MSETPKIPTVHDIEAVLQESAWQERPLCQVAADVRQMFAPLIAAMRAAESERDVWARRWELENRKVKGVSQLYLATSDGIVAMEDAVSANG